MSFEDYLCICRHFVHVTDCGVGDYALDWLEPCAQNQHSIHDDSFLIELTFSVKQYAPKTKETILFVTGWQKKSDVRNHCFQQCSANPVLIGQGIKTRCDSLKQSRSTS